MLCLCGILLKKRLSRREVASVWIWPCLSRYAVFLNAKVLYFNIRLMPVNLLKEDLLYQGMAVMWFARTLAMEDYSSVIVPNCLRLSNKRKALGSRKNIPS